MSPSLARYEWNRHGEELVSKGVADPRTSHSGIDRGLNLQKNPKKQKKTQGDVVRHSPGKFYSRSQGHWEEPSDSQLLYLPKVTYAVLYLHAMNVSAMKSEEDSGFAHNCIYYTH